MAPIDNAFIVAASLIDSEPKTDEIISRLTDKYDKELKNIVSLLICD